MKCSICKEKISADISNGIFYSNGKWDDGHNAQPITDGRCCDVCNDTIVVPARLMQFFLAKEAVDIVRD